MTTDAARRALDTARRHGLVARHAAKLRHLEGRGPTHRCRHCTRDIPLANLRDHLDTHDQKDRRSGSARACRDDSSSPVGSPGRGVASRCRPPQRPKRPREVVTP